MKNYIKLTTVCLLLVTVFSCKENEKLKDEVVETVSEIGLLNESDIQFDNAIEALESNAHIEAANYLKNGINALKKEGQDLTGDSKTILDVAVKQLNSIEEALRANKKINIVNLQEAMVNAELVVAHEYLVTDDFYFLTEPTRVDDQISQKQFRNNLSLLESTLKDESANKELDKDGSGQRLYDEGKALEMELENLMKKMNDHNKRANEHIKTHHPKLHVPIYYPFGA